MAFVTPIVPVTPMRLEASHRSEMVSQLLFGESATILESGKDFIKVSSQYDDYIGWIQKSQLVEISDEQALKGNGLLNGGPN